MPRRRDVKPTELAKIVKLRESDTSWLQIERDTGVPRQIAKRAYIERELSISREELKKAREVVAAEDLRWHIDCLIKIAKSLVDILDVPSFSDKRSANDVLLNLWWGDILEEYEAYRQPTEREIHRITHHNQLLFKSLQNHTREKIDWKALDNWKASWNGCKESRDKLKEEAKKILPNILKQEPKLKESIAKRSKNEDVIERMADGIVYTVWQAILTGKLVELIRKLDELKDEPDKDEIVDQLVNNICQEIGPIQAVSQSDGITEIIFGKTPPMTGLVFTNADLARQVIKICISVCDILCRGDDVKSLVAELRTMKKAINYLEENLDLIILRPMILNSPKCDLCPA